MSEPIRRRNAPLRLLALWAWLLAVFVLLIPQQFADPFLRSDDFPALRAEAALYEWKTLAKGRWLNWLWLQRDWPLGRETVFALHMAAWSLTAAAAGAGFFRADRGPGRALLLALAAGLMPQAADMAGWPATLLAPTVAVALFAVVAALARFRVMLMGLALLVPVALMGHSTAPPMMLALALLAADWTDPRARVSALIAVFVGALALGTLAMFGLNALVHGHFGLRLGDWLQIRPTVDATSGFANALAALHWFGAMLRHMALGQAPLALGLGGAVALALALLWRARWPEALRWLLVAGTVAGLMAAPALVQGIETPPRATGPLWLLLLAPIAGVARAGGGGAARGLWLGLLALMALSGAVVWHALHERSFAPYQAMTRALAARVADAAAHRDDIVLVRGQVHALPTTAALQFTLGFKMRLEDLTGLAVHLCEDQTRDLERGTPPRSQPWTRPEMAAWEQKRQADLAACAASGPAHETLPPWPAPGFLGPIAPGVLGLALPGLDQEKSEAMPSFSQSP